ncbi:hypothetical protein ABQE15_15650, partial [Enterococcus gallinarum]|uniref:hypothetical protein n=1 Tax=Enterococcus gallinarum TaxID=1353 RepID=UPI0032E39B17
GAQNAPHIGLSFIQICLHQHDLTKSQKTGPSDLKTPEFEQYFYAKIPIFNEISHENRSVLFF